jgi:hypothetical protein
MGASAGPNVISNGLVFAVDTASHRSISGLGCTDFNNAPQLLKNIISPLSTITSFNGVRLGNVDFYTAFGIDYPEGSFGGDAANRQGITPGFNVRSGTKTYDASRALHLWVWNNDTAAWVPSNFFNGLRLSGHCYDSFTGYGSWQTEVAKFVTDFNNIKNTFPNCTYIVCGSHRDSGHTTDKINILLDLGAPSNVSSLLGGSPEWILVGKPGLGAGNAYGWAYENYSTDPTRVAHLNFGLPSFGTKDNYLDFDGTNDYIAIANDTALNTQTPTVEVWVKTDNLNQNGFWFEKGSVNTQYSLFQEGTSIVWRQKLSSLSSQYTTTANYISTSSWAQIVGTFTTGNRRTYINGTLVTSDFQTGTIDTNNTGMYIGAYGPGTSYFYNGKLAVIRVYNRALSAAEVQQNFNATRNRFGV